MWYLCFGCSSNWFLEFQIFSNNICTYSFVHAPTSNPFTIYMKAFFYRESWKGGEMQLKEFFCVRKKATLDSASVTDFSNRFTKRLYRTISYVRMCMTRRVVEEKIQNVWDFFFFRLKIGEHAMLMWFCSNYTSPRLLKIRLIILLNFKLRVFGLKFELWAWGFVLKGIALMIKSTLRYYLINKFLSKYQIWRKIKILSMILK